MMDRCILSWILIHLAWELVEERGRGEKGEGREREGERYFWPEQGDRTHSGSRRSALKRQKSGWACPTEDTMLPALPACLPACLYLSTCLSDPRGESLGDLYAPLPLQLKVPMGAARPPTRPKREHGRELQISHGSKEL